MAGLIRYEQEVTIGFNAAEDTADLYTADPVWIRKLDKLVEQNPEQFKPGKQKLARAKLWQSGICFQKYLLLLGQKK